jgi:hypothetical protein
MPGTTTLPYTLGRNPKTRAWGVFLFGQKKLNQWHDALTPQTLAEMARLQSDAKWAALSEKLPKKVLKGLGFKYIKNMHGTSGIGGWFILEGDWPKARQALRRMGVVVARKQMGRTPNKVEVKSIRKALRGGARC